MAYDEPESFSQEKRRGAAERPFTPPYREPGPAEEGRTGPEKACAGRALKSWLRHQAPCYFL